MERNLLLKTRWATLQEWVKPVSTRTITGKRMKMMEEFTILELFVLLTVLEHAHANTLLNPLLDHGFKRDNVELEQRIIEKLRHIRQKQTATPDTIVLREVLADRNNQDS